ncbi:MAG TPA: alpha-E domain-containing protein [Abditibacteriaceae bacterium]|jgi:uncharacterized alpha-E superfamily protein
MLSRVADNLFWMARYFERAENTARLIDVNINVMLDMGHALENAGSGAPYWNPIVRIASPFDDFRASYPKTTADAAIEWLAFGANNPNSIVSCIGAARENARAIRGAISTEMWEQINTFYLDLQGSDIARVRREGAHSFFRDVRLASTLFQGITDLTLPRDEGWNWIQIGKYLERADATSRLLDVKYHILLPSLEEVGGPIDNVQWIAVLKSCSAYEAYQRRYVARISPSRVAEFLVLDRKFPRSVRFCFDSLHRALREVSIEHGANEDSAAEMAAARVRKMLAETTMSGIIKFGLHQYLLQIENCCGEIAGKIASDYFQGALRHAA